MNGLDEHIQRDNRVELLEDKWLIENYEYEGTFHTYEEAVEYLLSRTEHFDTKFPGDYIYKKELGR